MSLSAAALRKMLEMGLTADQMVELAEVLEQDIARAAPAIDEQADRRRSADRERKRRVRGMSAEMSADSSAETAADTTPAPDKEKSPLDPPKEINPTPERCAAPSADVRETDPVEDDWPEAEGDGKRAIATWAMRLTQIAGPSLADPAKTPSLLTSSVEIGRWRKAGCSWEVDVVPVIRARTAQPRAEPINAWTYFTQAILAQASRRKASLTIPEQPQSTADVRAFQPSRQSARTTASLERFEAFDAASRAALRS